MHAEFSVDLNLFLEFERHYKLTGEQETIDFVQELDQMLEGPE